MSLKVSFLSLILVVFLAVSARVEGVQPSDRGQDARDTESVATMLVINELMADNTGSVRDQNGDDDDWIEIYNRGDSAVNIGGMYLTDNQSAASGWRVPDNIPDVTTIAPKGFLLIWADDETNEGTLHANFRLGSDGENIRLFAADGKTLIDVVTFGSQAEDRSYGRMPDGSDNNQETAYRL